MSESQVCKTLCSLAKTDLNNLEYKPGWFVTRYGLVPLLMGLLHESNLLNYWWLITP